MTTPPHRLRQKLALLGVVGITAVTARAGVIVENTNDAGQASVKSGAADFNLRFGFDTAGQSFNTLILFGNSGQTMTENIDLNSYSSVFTITATEIPMSGYSEYSFNLASLNLGELGATSYILEVRSNVSSGAGIYTTTDSTATPGPDVYWTRYDGPSVEFELAETPETTNAALVGLAAIFVGWRGWRWFRASPHRVPGVPRRERIDLP